MPRPPAPGPTNTQDPATRDDLRRMRVWLEQLARDVDELQAGGGGGSGTVESVTSNDGSITVDNTDPANPDLSVNFPAAGDITAVTAGSGLTGGGTSGAVSLAADFGTGAGKVTEGNDSRLSDARTPTGAAGGDLSGTYPNPTVNTTSDIRSNFWARPASAHSSDQEFDSGTLPASCSLWDLSTNPATSVSPTTGISVFDATGPAAGNVRIEADTTYRRSWVSFQPRAENRLWFYGQQVTIPATAGMVVRSRFSTVTRINGPTVNNDGTLFFAMLTDDGSNRPRVNAANTPHTAIRAGFEPDAGSIYQAASWYAAGANTVVQSTGLGNSLELKFGHVVDFEVAFVQPSGGATAWHLFWRTPNMTHYVSTTLSFVGNTTVWVGWLFNGVGNDMPGAPIMNADYMRFANTVTGFIP